MERDPDLLAQISCVEQLRYEACDLAYAGNEQAALQVAERIRQIGESNDNELIQALSNWTYGNIHIILGQGFKSLAYYQVAEQFYEKWGDELNLARLRVGITGVLNQVGQYEKAYQVAQSSWSILAKSNLPVDSRRLAGLANNWGIACEFLGRYEEALDLYERKIDLWRAGDDTPKSRFEIARAHINLGILKKRLNLLHESEQDLEKGRQALACGNVYLLDLARAEMHLAHLKIRQRAPQEQIVAAFARAHDVLQGSPEQLISLNLFEAEWQLQSGHYPANFFQRLVALREECLQSGSLRAVVQIEILLAAYFIQQKNPYAAISRYTTAYEKARLFHDFELIFLAQYGLGRVFVQQGDLVSAQGAFEHAVMVVEQTKEELTSTELRPFFLEDKLAVYYNLSTLHIRQNQIPQAFHWIERARARELVEMLSSHHSHRGQHLTKEKFKAVALDEVCKMLPADVLFLLYALEESGGWVLPLTVDGFLKPRPLSICISQKEIEQSLRWLHNLAQYPERLVKRHGDMLIMAAQQPLANWYQNFLEPVQDLLEAYPRLIISPDGSLDHLPFHAFYNAQTGKYLAETHEVSRTPSATTWLLGKSHQPGQTAGMVLACAGEFLHHTTTEVKAITAVYPEFSVYMGEEATLEVLQSEEAQTAAIIHMASHAVFRGDNPYFSYVNLANGRLGMADILCLKLKARLVVLSACETGRGLPRGGEYLGLAYSFLLAGARSIIASHWPVDDVATSTFMEIFYQKLAAGFSPGGALRQAQLVFLSSSSRHLRHPYYWAPFFLLGTD